MRMPKPFYLTGLLALCWIALTACSNSDEAGSIVEPIKRVQSSLPSPEGVVLATVNKTPITDKDLNVAIESMVDKQSIPQLTAAQKRKILQSLVASRAIALASEKEMSTEALQMIERRVQAFREQLLIKRYLAQYADPQPVTQQMVQNYYDAHPEKFGARTIRSFEMISSKTALSGARRDSLLEAFSEGSRHGDWQAWSEQMIRTGHNVQYHQGQVDEKILETELQGIFKPLQKAEISPVSFIDGKPHIARITDEIKIGPRPLSEVSARIRKALLPIQLKAAVSKISEEAVENAEVTYANTTEGENS